MPYGSALVLSEALRQVREVSSTLPPGAHVAIFGGDTPTDVSAQARRSFLELRHTFLVHTQGPAAEFLLLFRRPLGKPSVEKNMVAFGTGALNATGKLPEGLYVHATTCGRRTDVVRRGKTPSEGFWKCVEVCPVLKVPLASPQFASFDELVDWLWKLMTPTGFEMNLVAPE